MPLRKKELFFNVRKKVPMAWGGGKGLSGRAAKNRTFFCGFPSGLPFKFDAVNRF